MLEDSCVSNFLTSVLEVFKSHDIREEFTSTFSENEAPRSVCYIWKYQVLSKIAVNWITIHLLSYSITGCLIWRILYQSDIQKTVIQYFINCININLINCINPVFYKLVPY